MDNWVSAIVGDTQGNIWVIIPDQGIFRYKDNELYFYEISNRRQFKQESPIVFAFVKMGKSGLASGD